MNKLYSFPLKILLVAIAGIFFLGFTFGIVGNTPDKEKTVAPTPTITSVPTKEPVREESQGTSVLKQQLKDCQDTVRLNIQALDLSSEILAISGNVILSIANEDINVLEIEKGARRVNIASDKISQLSDEAVPLIEKCFKD